MGFLESFVSFIVYLASTCGYVGIFILNMLEYACLPFPSEIVLPAIGASVASGKYSMIYALPISVIGGVVGTLISYSVGMYAGKKVISFAKRKHKKSKSIFEKIDRLFSRYGKITVFLGITIMDSFYLLLGYFAYDNKSFIEKALRHYSIALIIIIVIALFSYYIYKKSKIKET